jgi:hypothetical protein
MKKGERLELSISWVLKDSAPDELILGLATEALEKLRQHLATPGGTLQRLASRISIGPPLRLKRKRRLPRFRRRKHVRRLRGARRRSRERSPFPQCESRYAVDVPFLDTSLNIQCVLDSGHPGDHHAFNFSWCAETPAGEAGKPN